MQVAFHFYIVNNFSICHQFKYHLFYPLKQKVSSCILVHSSLISLFIVIEVYLTIIDDEKKTWNFSFILLPNLKMYWWKRDQSSNFEIILYLLYRMEPSNSKIYSLLEMRWRRIMLSIQLFLGPCNMRSKT